MIDFEGAVFLDMYSGSGIMWLEALSRGFSKIIMIEKNKSVFNIIKKNIEKYEKDNDIKLILGDSLNVCQKLSSAPNIVYIDPPYFSNYLFTRQKLRYPVAERTGFFFPVILVADY